MLKLVVVLAVLGLALSFPTNDSVLVKVTDKKVPLLNGRIVGGDVTEISRHPWTLALLYYLQHFCGAVLFHFRWGLTTAHCLEGAVISNLAVRAGSTTRSSGGQIIDIVNAYIHPNFDPYTIDYDFAVLEFGEPVSVPTAAPIALPEPNQPVLEGAQAIIAGWGTFSAEAVTTPELLHAVEVPVVSQEDCEISYGSFYITSTMFCTGILGVGGKDACIGDGGGPVNVDGYLAGLVSWGSGCGEPFYPGVQAKVSVVVNWIYEVSGV